MTDTPLFNLDAEGRWRLAYDPLQWIVQKRAGRAGIDPSSNRDSGFRGVFFIGSKKRSLGAFFREKQIKLTPEAYRRFRALPLTFAEFRADLQEPSQSVKTHFDHDFALIGLRPEAAE